MTKISDIGQCWQIFKKSFIVDTSQQPIYLMTRYRIGSKLAGVAAAYNTYLLHQKILKNSIYITQSKNPRVVKCMCVFVGFLYYSGLYCLWHIPSLFSEVAVRVYVSTQDAVTNYLLKRHLQEILVNNQKLGIVLKKDGLRL